MGSSLSWLIFLVRDQELQRKLAEEQVAAAMGQAPPVTSVAAGAAAMGLTMGGMLPGAGAGVRAQAAPVMQVYTRSIYKIVYF